MKSLNSFGFVLCFFAFGVTGMQAQDSVLDNLVLDGKINGNTVTYSIENTGSSAATVNFIIIQDNVLGLANQVDTIDPGETLVIQTTAALAYGYEFKLTVPNNGSGYKELRQ